MGFTTQQKQDIAARMLLAANDVVVYDYETANREDRINEFWESLVDFFDAYIDPKPGDAVHTHTIGAMTGGGELLIISRIKRE